MPTTGPITIDASPTRKVLSIQYVDINGQPRTDSYEVPIATTDAEMNTLVTALGAGTNANIWRVGVTNEFGSATGSKADAVNAVDDSVKDNIVLLYKSATPLTAPIDLFIPAPIEVLLVAGTVNPDPTATEMIAIVAAADAIWDAWDIASYRYSERRKKNRAVKA